MCVAGCVLTLNPLSERHTLYSFSIQHDCLVYALYELLDIRTGEVLIRERLGHFGFWSLEIFFEGFENFRGLGKTSEKSHTSLSLAGSGASIGPSINPSSTTPSVYFYFAIVRSEYRKQGGD